MKALTPKQLNDRLDVLEDLITYLEMTPRETTGEQEQALILASQMRTLSTRLLKKLQGLTAKTHNN